MNVGAGERCDLIFIFRKSLGREGKPRRNQGGQGEVAVEVQAGDGVAITEIKSSGWVRRCGVTGRL